MATDEPAIAPPGAADDDLSLDVADEQETQSSLLGVEVMARSGAQPILPDAASHDIASYWRLLLREDSLPSWSDLDLDFVDRNWPRNVLLACQWEQGALSLEIHRSHFWQTGVPEGLKEEDYLALTEWLLMVAREAANSGQPAEGVETFSHRGIELGLKAVALPFADDGERVDHVLCQIGEIA